MRLMNQNNTSRRLKEQLKSFWKIKFECFIVNNAVKEVELNYKS
jgi:hypothetical protein